MSDKLTIRQQLTGDEFKRQVAMALPKHLTPERFIRVALTALNRVPKLANTTPQSLFKCLLDCSALGIEPDSRRAYLIPYGSECTLIISYMGLIELVKRNGDVSNVFGALVYENDAFKYQLGTERRIDHFPRLKDRGEVIGAYAVVTFKDGASDFEYMDVGEIEGIRKRSMASKNGPWVTDWGEMAKKTVIRRVLKRQTLSPEIRDAIEKDDEADFKFGNMKRVEVSDMFLPPEENPLEEPPEAAEGPLEDSEGEETQAEAIDQEEADFFKAGMEGGK